MGTLLDAYGDHLKHLEEEIRNLERDAPEEVLDVWFRYSPDPQALDTNPTRLIGPEMTLSDVLRITLEFDSALSEFYRSVAESTEIKRVREIFLELASDIEAEKKKLTGDV
jgi:hypothetical protein